MRIVTTISALAGLMAIAACDSGASAVETRDRAAVAQPLATTATSEATTASTEAPKPVVTANRRETVDAKIQRLYERNGASFGARSAEDYLAKVTAFTVTPPRDVDTAKRPNGDTLLYQASTNTFAVVSRDGVARTMFKPDDGPTYWAQQKERAPTFGRRQTATDG